VSPCAVTRSAHRMGIRRILTSWLPQKRFMRRPRALISHPRPRTCRPLAMRWPTMGLHTSERISESANQDTNLRKVHCLHQDLADLRFVSQLGRGGFGSVTLVRQKRTGLLYSIKVTDPREMGKKDLQLSDRIDLHHPFIVRMRKSLEIESGKQLAIFDFVRGPELRHLIHAAPSLVRENAPFYLSQLVLALDYLSDSGIQHRDLKPGD